MIAKSSTRNKAIVNEYVSNKEKYGKTLVFAVNKLYCKTLYEEFNKSGIKCNYCISGEGKANEVIHNFRQNKFEVLINVQILTEGSDVPDIKKDGEDIKILVYDHQVLGYEEIEDMVENIVEGKVSILLKEFYKDLNDFYQNV